MDEVHVKFNEHKDEAYKLNFNIITFQKTFDSNMSSTKFPKVAGQNHDSSYCSWSYDQKKQPLHLQQNKTENGGLLPVANNENIQDNQIEHPSIAEF